MKSKELTLEITPTIWVGQDHWTMDGAPDS